MEEQVKNTLWVFGCSFAAGTGCNPKEEYYENTKHLKKKKYSQLLGEKYDLNVYDLSVPGTSNEMILYRIIESIPLMRKNDLVVIGKTDPTRSYMFTSDRNWLNKEDRRYGFDHRYVSLIPTHLEILKGKSGYEDNFIDELTSVFYTTRFRQSKILTSYYNDFFDNTISIIDQKCKVVSWSHNLWKHFHTIQQDTNGRLIDGHYSWKGHQQLFDYLVRRIKDKYEKII